VELKNGFQQTNTGRGTERRERGKNRFFLIIKIIGWEALLLPNQKTQN
jgi:hypothetical protein